MYIKEIIENRKMSVYKLSKISNIPYATLSDIVNGKAKIAKCSAETVYRLANALNVSMDDLISPYIEKPVDFELFKSNICHRLKELGDTEFLIKALESNDVIKYYEQKQYKESFYLLAMIDYLSRINKIPLCADYSDIRKHRLSETLYPSSVIAQFAVSDSEEIKTKAYNEAIPEFIAFNIVESGVFDVV